MITGVEIHIRPVVYITIEGGLRAEGTQAEGILFKSLTNEKWRGIKVNPTSTDSIVFRHTRIENCKEGIKVYKRPFAMDHCVFWNILKLHLETCQFSITSSELRTCEIYSEGYSQANGVIRDNNLHHTMTGINLKNTVSCSIINNNIYSNTSGIGIMGEEGKMTQQIIEIYGNRIYDNSGIGVGLVNCNVGQNLKHNIISNNGCGISIGRVMGTISENTLKHNKASFGFIYQASNETSIYSNCIDSTKEFLVTNSSSNDITIDYNYWGMQDTTKMHAMTKDYYTDFVSGKVFYTPIEAGSPHCQILFPTAVNEVTNTTADDVKVYPNPFSDNFTIELSNPSAIASVELYNMLGVNISSVKVTDKKMNIDLVNYPAGIYIYKVVGKNNGMTSGRILKQ
jgi:hypothetical protein